MLSCLIENLRLVKADQVVDDDIRGPEHLQPRDSVSRLSINQVQCHKIVNQPGTVSHGCQSTRCSVTRMSINQVQCHTVVNQPGAVSHGCQSTRCSVTRLSINQVQCHTIVNQPGAVSQDC